MLFTDSLAVRYNAIHIDTTLIITYVNFKHFIFFRLAQFLCWWCLYYSLPVFSCYIYGENITGLKYTIIYSIYLTIKLNYLILFDGFTFCSVFSISLLVNVFSWTYLRRLDLVQVENTMFMKGIFPWCVFKELRYNISAFNASKVFIS